MNKKVLIGFLLTMFGQLIFAQQNTVIIKANSKNIKILDGDDLREGTLVPGLNPDIYTYHRTNKPKKIIYYTDIDSISFTVNQGDNYKFAIVLNNTDTCFQEISADNPNKVSYIKPPNRLASTNDTIPFTLGANNAIHIKGKINNSDPLDLIFDTGASVGVLSDEAASKHASLKQDNKNSFEFAGITILNSPAILVDYNGNLRGDGVIGYNAFEGKIVEINYDRNILVVHTSLEKIPMRYSAIDMIWRGSNLYIEGILKTTGKQYKGLFLFDTGSKFALSITKSFASSNQLYNELKKVGTRRGKGVNGKTIKSNTVILPEFEIGGFPLKNVPTDLELPAEGDGLAYDLLGNDVLKRFNVILDYDHSVVYLQPNSLINTAYNKVFDEKWIWIITAIVISLLILCFIYYRKRKELYKAIG